jgi:hypothetical protein
MARIYCIMFKCSNQSIVGYFTGRTAFDYRTHATILTSPVVRLGNCVLGFVPSTTGSSAIYNVSGKWNGLIAA